MIRLRKSQLIAVAAAAAALAIVACSSESGAASSPSSSSGPPTAPSVASGAFDSARPLAAQLSGSQQQVGVWVNGSGAVTAAPDVGILSFGVETRADSVATARNDAAAAMDAVVKALRAAGVQDKDMQTTQLSIQPVYSNPDPRGGGGTPQIIGYRVNNSATAKVRNLPRFGETIDAAAKAGGNAMRIQSIGFTIDDPKPLEAQARGLAVKDATAKAQQIAQASGISLGNPIFVSESGGAPIVAPAPRFEAAAAADVSTPILTGESRVVVNVQMVFPIK